ncbi:hypothetical protein [Blastococcus sp. TF02A-30]|uniref:hypothetical protein n=1 Tax=Blastococcus sp. TF02A-30 TaxID=2250580 RepID=UPI001F1F570F|nr:hypothetical protein [Blastococcus sp. TF02A-30]
MTRCSAPSSPSPLESRSDMAPVTSAMSRSRAALRRARSSVARRSVMSRKYTESPSGLGQARTSYQASSGAP